MDFLNDIFGDFIGSVSIDIQEDVYGLEEQNIVHDFI
jgi:hypothetical protein